MASRARRYRKSADRRVWVFSELNHDLQPEQIAKILVAAALEQARLEASKQQAIIPPEFSDGAPEGGRDD